MMMFYRFMFQKSLIFDMHYRPDPYGEVRIVNAKSEDRARKRLPDPGAGRVWVLLESEAK